MLLTGIHLMRTGAVVANLPRLNDTFGLPQVPELIRRKVEGREAGTLAAAVVAFHRGECDRLLATLAAAGAASTLPVRRHRCVDESLFRPGHVDVGLVAADPGDPARRTVGGLRTPSETLSLQWTDVDWANSRLRVPSPRTAHLESGASRTIPLFPVLRLPLLQAFEAAEPGATHVVLRYRSPEANLRTHLERIVRRAGLEPWPGPFQNLRSTRATELAETFPMHVVCRWIGNSEPVAARHDLQVTDEHFTRAVTGAPAGTETGGEEAAQKAAQQAPEEGESGGTGGNADTGESIENAEDFQGIPSGSEMFSVCQVPPKGIGTDPVFSEESHQIAKSGA